MKQSGVLLALALATIASPALATNSRVHSLSKESPYKIARPGLAIIRGVYRDSLLETRHGTVFVEKRNVRFLRPYASHNEKERKKIPSGFGTDEVHMESVIATHTSNYPVMRAIAWCESKLDPEAKNGKSSATGLFQIIAGTWKAFGCSGDRMNPIDNARCADKIATQSGLHHWAKSSSCWKRV